MDLQGQPTGEVVDRRRRAEFITPVPQAKAQRDDPAQAQLGLRSGDVDLGGTLDPYPIINDIRAMVDRWRSIPNPADWGVTPTTERLLRHWRSHEFQGLRPFFCQVEAVETAIWLAEVAPNMGKRTEHILEHLNAANAEANPELFRIALKLATGAGKTTVMAMLIAWQALNKARRPNAQKFTKGFLIVAPGITIRDRLQVLQPNDPNSYYASRELVPADMLEELQQARIVITNYHAFRLRETMELSKVGRSFMKGHGEEPATTETEGAMVARVAKPLMGMRNIIVINDEAHHCYRERPETEEEKALKGAEKAEAEENSKAARLWINGIEAVKRKLGVRAVYDLSATPFFLSGSGYPEGTLFPWTVSDFSLMDAIECGIVKLPRIPISDNTIDRADMPKFRDLWRHIGTELPKGKRASGKFHDPLGIPPMLETALKALYGHYEDEFERWKNADIEVPPVFIVVCANTATSKMVHDYISGFRSPEGQFHNGRLEKFRNFDNNGEPLERPRTLLIDSSQLESGEGLSDDFKKVAEGEIERFKYELRQRGKLQEAENLTDADILREVMNTVGKKGALGESIRCVVSVSMLTEGWDCNTVTHVLGVRAFGTQLLCEQVIGRALRRQSYALNEEGRFDPEYADVLGIPFDFAAEPVRPKPTKPRETVHVHAVSPERDHLAITFPRVEGYRNELPPERLEARFNADSSMVLTPDMTGPTTTETGGIIGERNELSIDDAAQVRKSELIYNLTARLIYNKFRDAGGEPKMHLFGPLKRIVRRWLDDGYLVCKGGTVPGQLLYAYLADMAAERIADAVAPADGGEPVRKAVLDPYKPTGSTMDVNFTTSKTHRWKPEANKCHLNWIILDSDWEAEFCRIAEAHPRVLSYVKNHALGFEAPYLMGGQKRWYRPDFLLHVDDGNGPDDPLKLIVEISGYPKGDKAEKARTMRESWVKGVNNAKTFGRWDFVEFTEAYEMEAAFKRLIEDRLNAQPA
nr:DEAD/DEAH box helicase family protein [Marinicauda salina]